MPLRDDRRGRRATLDGNSPLRPLFESDEPTRKPASPPPPGPFTLFAAIRRQKTRARNGTPAENSASPHEQSEPSQPQAISQSSPPPEETHLFNQSSDSDEWWRAEQRSFAAELAALIGDRVPERLSGEAPATSAAPASSNAADGAGETGATPEVLAGVRNEPVALDRATTVETRAEPSPAQSAAGDRSKPQSPNEIAIGAEAEPLVVHAVRAPIERIVPITRLPLRPQRSAIEWPQRLSGSSATLAVEDRHALLRELATRAAAPEWRDALDQAYREEGAEGRVLALRALLRGHYDARDTFVDALHVGTDDERSLAVDALLGLELRDELIPAFSDRVEAIAAKAALVS